MTNLVIKDILVQKKTFIYSILYAFFAIAAFTTSFTARGAYMFGAMSIAYLFIMYSNSYDEKNKCEVMLNSLPIKRKDIVGAKYLSLLIFAALGIFITSFAGMVINYSGLPINVRVINIGDIMYIVTTLGLMYSIYYPLYFKFGLMKIKIFNLFLYLFFLFGPITSINYMKNNPDNKLIQSLLSMIVGRPAWAIQTAILTAALLLVLISLSISIKLYYKKEF